MRLTFQRFRFVTLLSIVCAQLACPSLSSALDVILRDDTYTGQYSSSINKPYGTSITLFVSGATSGAAWNRRTWLQFDLHDALPAGITWDKITKATLRVYVTAVTTAGPVQVFAAGASWDESSLTHTNAPSPPLADPVSQLPYDTEMVAAADVNEFVSFDVTTLVHDWIDNTQTNNGVVLVAGNVTTNVSLAA